MNIPDNSQYFNSEVSKRCVESNMNKTRLSQFVRVRRATVSEWINNGGVPNLDPARMQRLQVALNCDSVGELVALFQPDQKTSIHELRKELEQQ